jgi:uncharacterized membrane protein YcfT
LEHTKQALDFLLYTGGIASAALAIKTLSDMVFKWIALEAFIKAMKEFNKDEEEFFRFVEQNNLPVPAIGYPDASIARSM